MKTLHAAVLLIPVIHHRYAAVLLIPVTQYHYAVAAIRVIPVIQHHLLAAVPVIPVIPHHSLAAVPVIQHHSLAAVPVIPVIHHHTLAAVLLWYRIGLLVDNPIVRQKNMDHAIAYRKKIVIAMTPAPSAAQKIVPIKRTDQ